MKKKVIAILLSLSMIVGIMPTLAFATSGETTPVTETTAPTESTPAVCSVCQTENCTKSHAFCETCQQYDCGVDHTAVPTSEIVKCGTCGQENCESKHENWCATCLKDDCGIDHDAPKTCETCGETLGEDHTCPTDPVCSCSVLCKADAPKVDCPVCSAEGGVCTGSDKYVTVQAMIDALRTEFKESEREAALAEYEAATKAISELSEEEFALLDLTNYYAAANPTVIPEDPVVCKIGEDEYTSLSAAIAAANKAGSATTIVLTDNITLSEKLTITGDVTIDGSGHTIIRGKTADDAWYTGSFFDVNGTLNLNGVIVDGANAWVLDEEKFYEGACSRNNKSSCPFIYNDDLPAATSNVFNVLNGGNLRFNDSTIQNHFIVSWSGSSYNGSVLINLNNNTNVTLTGTTINHCAGLNAGSVIRTWNTTKSSIEMTNSSIVDCFGATNGSIVSVSGSNVTFNMTNSTIDRCWGIDGGAGAVLVIYSGAVFTLGENAAVKNFKSVEHTATVIVRNGAKFVLDGGSISDNLGGQLGGLYVYHDGSTLELENGTISGNAVAIPGYEYADGIYASVPITIGKNVIITDNVYCSADWINNGTINGDVTARGTLTNTGTITGTVTLYIPAGSNLDDYFKNTGTHTGELIVYYTVTDEYPYVLNLYYNGGTDQVGWNGSGHLKWTPNGAETKDVTIANITNAVTVTKYGYTFAGWFYDEALIQPVTDPITLTKGTAKCLYAAWEKTKAEINYTAVTQNYGKQAAVSTSGGTVSGSETVDATVAAVNGSTITVNEGYTFAGWFTDEACTQKVTASWVGTDNKLTPQKNNEGLYESGSYYALFEEMTTTVTYKVADSGTGSVYFEEASAAETITDTFGKVTGSPKTATAKPANGYMFVGWYTDEACTMLHSKQAAMNSSENGTFYAKFIKDHAIVTIEKTVDKASSSDQSFILNISGTSYNNDPVNVDVVIVISAGKTSGSVKVVLPVSNGDYSISDQDGWNWRYKVKDNATITINGGDSDSVLSVTSTLENSKWFAGSYIYAYKKES